MKKYILSLLSILLISQIGISQTSNYASYVNPFIGTGGHGHTFPGATVPFGMVQLSPDTRIDGSWDGCSGYHHSDSIIYGFSHTHLSGTGCSDYGDVMIMPMMGAPSFDNKIYSSKYSHKNEKATAGFYSIKLEDDNIDVELTTTTRVGFHKYTFNKEGDANIILDLEHRDKLIDGQVIVIDSKTLEVYRRSEAWAKDQILFARIEFSKDFIENGKSIKENVGSPGTFSNACQAYSFKVKKGDVLMVKVSISNVSAEGANKNMKAELPGWDFEKTKKEAEAVWNKELSKIEVTSNDKDKLSIFYTALYHTMIQPNVAMDVDGMYRGRDNKTHKAEGFTYYSVFSLWDTFRAAHPLYTIIDRKRTSDFINTFLAQYEQGGRLPVWELASNETDCMIGYHSVSLIADAMEKGIKGFDYQKAFEASKHSAMLDHLGLEAYKKNGVISMDDEHESVSKTLEYAYDDWCIAQIAKLTNNSVDYDYFMKRSQSWKNTFDPETGFMRPRKNGGWLSPFDPKEVNNNFTEGNSWQYSFFVPQDIFGLIDKMGGAAKFENKLDELFSTSSKTTGREQADITGLIGQYAHGNEPSHHMAYLYNYVNKGYKTEQHVNQILNDFYKNDPDGLIGNEDCGQMSAWFVLSSLGFYQVTPGTNKYILGTPHFKEVKVHLENGKTFNVKSNKISKDDFYVQSKKLKLTPHPLMPKDIELSDNWSGFNHINYESIIGGATLEFEMSENATIKQTMSEGVYVLENSPAEKILTVPSIRTTSNIFDDRLKIEILSDSEVKYAIVVNINDKKIFSYYKGPFTIYSTQKIFAYSENDHYYSDTIHGTFYKRPNNWDIKIISKYNPQYTAGGDKGIIDGVGGETNWRKGEWQGYQSQNFECIIDLKKEQAVSSFNASFLQDTRAWIVMPTKVEYYTSSDNINFKLVGTINNTIDAKDYEVQIKNLDLKTESVKARYVKVKAYNYGKLPEWHQGAGGDAFIFVDEIDIK